MEISQESPPPLAVTTTTTTGTEVSASSPEFEFWMLGKSPQPSSLLTADELFVDGVLLPLHLLSISHSNASADSQPDELNLEPPPPTTTTSSAASPAPPPPPTPPTHTPRKWRDHIPRAGGREKAATEDKEQQQRRPKERRGGSGSGGGPAELNINIWPFSRSRSAGNAAAAASGSWSARARAAVAGRNVSSAPCSRSNSRGESSAKPATTTTAAASPSSSSSSRRWVPSASRVAAFAGGIHLGRTAPVWKIHKKVTNQPAGDPQDKPGAAAVTRKATAGSSTPAAAGVRVLNFHVNTCIGYRNRESCSSSDDPSRIPAGGGESGGGGGAGGSGGGSIFKLRTIFSRNSNARVLINSSID